MAIRPKDKPAAKKTAAVKKAADGRGKAKTAAKGAAKGSPLAEGAPPLSCFVAGIIQGSFAGSAIHPQDYRSRVAALLRERYPDADVYDPFAEHPESVGYDFDFGRDVFFELMERAGRVDVLVAFVPSASMGTAIELWNAFHAGAVVVAVSPLTENWVVKFLADAVAPDLEAFEAMVRDGRLDRLIEDKIVYRKR